MIVFRIARQAYANDLTGEGARLFGGRWNNKEYACIYASESRALALLEFTVNVNLNEIPPGLCMITLEIPPTILEYLPEDLPANWRQSPAATTTKNLGTAFLIENKLPVLKVPSVIIPQENNYLLNPKHAKNKEFKILQVDDFLYDPRIKT